MENTNKADFVMAADGREELRRLAEKATPGPWMHLFGDRIVYDRMEDGCRGNAIVSVGYPCGAVSATNLDYVAAANPQAILALLDELAATERRNEMHAQASVDMANRLHAMKSERANPASPASAPEASEPDAIAQRTEEIRLRHGFPHTSRKQLAYDVECLLAHIAMMRAQLEASEESRMELLRLLNEETSGSTFMGEPVLPPRSDVSEMVNRFLGWPLPKSFSPDCGISFDGRKDDEWNKNKTWPVGTNLLNAEEAKAMFQHCLAAPLPPVVARKELTDEEAYRMYERSHVKYMGTEYVGATESREAHYVDKPRSVFCPVTFAKAIERHLQEGDK